MHKFSTLKECTSLARLAAKNPRESQGSPEARARAGVKITRNSSLSCYNYGPDVQPHRKNRCVGDLGLQHQGFPWQSGTGLRSLFRRTDRVRSATAAVSYRPAHSFVLPMSAEREARPLFLQFFPLIT